MGNISNVLGFPFVPSIPRTPEEQMRDAMLSQELAPPELILDGHIHRFSVGTSKDAGWYVGFVDSYGAGGAFGNWRTGESTRWSNVRVEELNLEQRVAHDRHMAELWHLRDEERKKQQSLAADTVQSIWSRAGLASPDHPYLKRKMVKSHGLRITGDGRLMVPIYHKSGELVNLQYISDDGTKRFHKSAEIKGCFYTIGDVASSDMLYIAEGYATASTVHEATGKAVVVAFNAGNMLAATESIRIEAPDVPITVIADNDENGTGLKAAQQVSASFGAKIIMPPDIGSDINDFAVQGGDVHMLLTPSKEEQWLIWADEFCAQPKPIRWLVKHWIQEDAMIMVHGPSGCGKTFLVLDWCLHIASSLPTWCDRRVRDGTVIYLAGEGHHGLRGRVAAWKQYHQPNEMRMAISNSGTDLNTIEGLQKTVTAIREIHAQPRLIVVDTLHRFLMGDENSAQDTKTMLDSCALLMREFDCSVLLVHHTGVSAEAQHRARGSSAWKGALDIEISVEKKEKSDTMKVIQRKNKDAELTEDIHLMLHQVELDGWYDEDGDPISSVVLVPTEVPEDRPSRSESKYIDILRTVWGNHDLSASGNPVITKGAITSYLIDEMGKTGKAARTYLHRVLKKLEEIGVVSTFENHVEITNAELSFIMKQSYEYDEN